MDHWCPFMIGPAFSSKLVWGLAKACQMHEQQRGCIEYPGCSENEGKQTEQQQKKVLKRRDTVTHCRLLKTALRGNTKKSESGRIWLWRGVKQGDVSSPVPFNLVRGLMLYMLRYPVSVETDGKPECRLCNNGRENLRYFWEMWGSETESHEE